MPCKQGETVELVVQNDPGGQKVCMEDPDMQYAPTVVHMEGVAEAKGQNEPVGHIMQFALPPKALYVPAGHGLHTVPLDPLKPGLHVQF